MQGAASRTIPVRTIPVLGACVHMRPGQETGPALLSGAGLRWARLSLDWNLIQPQRGRFAWGAVDSWVAKARAAGLQILATIAYAPPWATGAKDHASPPLNAGDWANFVRNCAVRYASKVRHWSLTNEANLPDFWRGDIETWVGRMLVPGVTALRDVDPACRIGGPELSHDSKGRWPKWMAAACKAVQYDFITHHVYKDVSGFRSIWQYLDGFMWPWDGPNLRGQLTRNGVDKLPVWITETGWHSDETGEPKQAKNIAALLKGIAQRDWIEGLFLYEAADDPGWEKKWGLMHSNMSPKPALDECRKWTTGGG